MRIFCEISGDDTFVLTRGEAQPAGPWKNPWQDAYGDSAVLFKKEGD